MLLNIKTWSAFKTLVANKQLPMQYTEDSVGYELYCPDAHDILWHLYLLKTDASDFENNYKEDANGQIHSAVKIGGFRTFEQDLYHKSFKYTTQADTTNEYSESFSMDVHLSGGMYEVIGAVTDGDYVEFSVTDEDNVLGYGAGFTITKFLEKEYINPDRKYREVSSEDAALIPSGLYLTLTYHCAGSATPTVLVRYKMRK